MVVVITPQVGIGVLQKQIDRIPEDGGETFVLEPGRYVYSDDLHINKSCIRLLGSGSPRKHAAHEYKGGVCLQYTGTGHAVVLGDEGPEKHRNVWLEHIDINRSRGDGDCVRNLNVTEAHFRDVCVCGNRAGCGFNLGLGNYGNSLQECWAHVNEIGYEIPGGNGLTRVSGCGGTYNGVGMRIGAQGPSAKIIVRDSDLESNKHCSLLIRQGICLSFVDVYFENKPNVDGPCISIGEQFADCQPQVVSLVRCRNNPHNSTSPIVLNRCQGLHIDEWAGGACGKHPVIKSRAGEEGALVGGVRLGTNYTFGDPMITNMAGVIERGTDLDYRKLGL